MHCTSQALGVRAIAVSTLCGPFVQDFRFDFCDRTTPVSHRHPPAPAVMNKGRSYGFSAELERKAKGNYSEDKEQECRDWIEAIVGEELVPVETGWNNFSAALKDGIILCKLINIIQPGSVKKINQSKMAFKMMENTGNFLTGCERLGVPVLDLFQTVDLYEARNMNSVLCGLEALGRRAQVIHFDGPTFGAKPSTQNRREFSEETLKAGQNVIGLQMGTNLGANQSGMSYGTRRQVYDPQVGTK